MTTPSEAPEFGGPGLPPQVRAEIRHELHHLRDHWWWLTVLGSLLVVCGTLAIVLPTVTAFTTFAAVVMLGIMLMIAGVAVTVGAFWTGKWSGFMLQLLVGLLYLVGGFLIVDAPEKSALPVTLLLAAFFIVLGVFRVVVALTYRFPQWGWMLLNGAITWLVGVVIYRHLPSDSLWVIGLLVGLEMLFNGWTWIMISLVIRRIPKHTV